MSGSGLPGEMWEGFMNQAHKDMGLPNKRLTDGMGGRLGDPSKGEFPNDKRRNWPWPWPERTRAPRPPRPAPIRPPQEQAELQAVQPESVLTRPGAG